ncbi:hypothetical protein CPBF426_18150 [Xanthomonas arboricola pv. juglandis]|uniref:Uncharacterized protein n=1 Tax=Xanthomonas euroxanthea TaxID=2259622 RepID=A0AA46HAH9_9XANT|nr:MULTISPECIES: hypothetical protein [Xanthomonas]SYZ52720.1 hypothetical protein CPBF426_18150 [Xanthomonas arboricola pv. juglandis]MBB3779615.1 hypothetical protein [Xanthomonas euroxanthea]MBB5767840.1 hypothetical protein [Xanthomonas euroxanthea]NIK07947.1 hypothetical protein [Xanthomonas euroxanthea]NIK38141.1 hypothetical protein [Xanthomonas euroxanthea]
MNNKQSQPDKAADNQHGVSESQQDRKQDEAAKQRPGQKDLQVHDEQTRRPKGNAGQGE